MASILTGPVDHRQECETALRLYIESLVSPRAAEDWRISHVQSRSAVIAALKATNCLEDISGGLQSSGKHLAVIRHLLAPPMSQDQFSLLCPAYSKSAEKTGRGLPAPAADSVAAAFMNARDKYLTRWLNTGVRPTRGQIKILLHSVVPMLSQQVVATLRRTRMSIDQESAVINLLQSKGWERSTFPLINDLSALPPKHYMHKTKFATRTRPQEVDVACGLGKTVVLAMECKVTNDVTNSVKRINDILKKSSAWQAHWGSFVRTAALLQGVIAYKEIERLLEADVHVFWSHNLGAFEDWIENSVTI